MASGPADGPPLLPAISSLGINLPENLPTGGLEKSTMESTQPGPAGGADKQPMSPPAPTAPPQAQTSYRFLSPDEWARVAHGLGAIRHGDEHRVVHPSAWYFPPRGMSRGLYRDVVVSRTKYRWAFLFLGTVRWS